MNLPATMADPDRLLKMLEASKGPWRRTLSMILFYAAQADCAYRRMPSP